MDYILDASLILANLNRERGGERLPEFLDDSAVSIVTYVEVITKLMDGGATFEAADRSFAQFGLPAIPVTDPVAKRAAQLRESTRKSGLSLGDRICLSTAEAFGATAVTADRAWRGLDIGIGIEFIR